MHQLIEKLIASGPAVTDGSWSTQMQRRGLARGEWPDSWTLTHADLVEPISKDTEEDLYHRNRSSKSTWL